MTSKKIAEETAPATIETVDEALAAQLEELRAQLDNAREEIKALNEQLAARPSGRSGWLIRTPFNGYNGSAAGVIFRAGLAFLPDTEEGKKKAEFLRDEFDYSLTYVTDYQAIDDPAAAQQVGTSLVDALIVPQRR